MWRARVVDDFPSLACRIHLADIAGNGRGEFIVQLGPGRDTTLQSIENGVAGPDGMLLPAEAAEPLRDALNAYLGKPADDYRAKYEEARDALEVERRRVDALLAQMSGPIDLYPEDQTCPATVPEASSSSRVDL